jgi:hypothetical protein
MEKGKTWGANPHTPALFGAHNAGVEKGNVGGCPHTPVLFDTHNAGVAKGNVGGCPHTPALCVARTTPEWRKEAPKGKR